MTACDYTVSDAKRMSFDDLRDELRKLRAKPLRKSQFVAAAGERLIQSGGLGVELWVVLEQTFLACLDTGNFDYAKACIEKLTAQFGEEAKKVLRLRGMFMEAQGRFSEAEKVYTRILTLHPTDKCAVWRRVAVAKAQGRVEDAIGILNTHLKMVNAEEGHMELMRIYLSLPTPDYDKAAAACEELLLAHTANYGFLMLYAEIQYSTARGKSSLILARKYFSEAIVANEGANNTRSVWGLLQTCRDLAKTSLTPEEEEENIRVTQWAESRLSAIYERVGGPMARNASAVLSA